MDKLVIFTLFGNEFQRIEIIITAPANNIYNLEQH